MKITTKIVICSEFLWCMLWLTLYIELALSRANHSWFFSDAVKAEYRKKIAVNFVLMLLPLSLFLIVKIFNGIVWWLTPSRNSFSKYYLVSFVYYLSLDVEFILVLFTAMDVLSEGAQIVGWVLVVVTIPFLVMLKMYMDYIDQQHFKVNRFTNVILKRISDARR